MRTAKTDAQDGGIVIGTNNYLVDKLLGGMFIAGVIMTLGATITMTIDNIVAGNMIGETALAALNVAMPLFVFASLISGILATGGASLAARYLGNNDKGKVNSLFTMVLCAQVIIGVILIAIVYPNLDAIALAIGARDEAVRVMAVDYMRGILIALILIMFNSTFVAFVRLVGSSILVALSVLIMSAVNIVGNFVLVGPLDMGMFGLALASAIAKGTSCIIFTVYIIKKKCLRLSLPRGVLKDFVALVNIGLPSALNSLNSIVRSVALNVVVAMRLGTPALNAMAASGSVGNLVGCVSLGVGFTIQPLTGVFFGEQDKVSLGKTIKRSLRLGLIVNIVLAVLVSIFARFLTSIFNITDEATTGMVMRAIWFYALSMPFIMITFAFVNYYQNAKKIWLANLILVSKVIFVLLFTIPAIDRFGDLAIWAGAALSEVASMILIVVAVWVVNKKFPTSMNDFMLVPKEWDAGVPTYEVSLKNDINDCAGLSTKIQTFCAENGASKKVAYYTALCMEEMAANIINHGFKGTKDHFIDIKVIISGDKVKLRIRDDGKEFNPFDYLEQQDKAREQGEDSATGTDEYSNIGIRMVKELASHGDYRYTMRLNNLFVEITYDKTLKLSAAPENWEVLERFIRSALSASAVPPKEANRVILASEELFINIAEQSGTDEINTRIKPTEDGISVSFQYKGEAYDPTKADDKSDENMGLKIVKQAADLFTYSYGAKKNNATICKYWKST